MSCRSSEDHYSESIEAECFEKVLGRASLAISGTGGNVNMEMVPASHLEHEGKKIVDVTTAQSREARTETRYESGFSYGIKWLNEKVAWL